MAPNLSLVKLAKLVRAGYRLVKDPNRLDEVIAMADDLSADNEPAFDAILVHARASDTGRAALRDKPRVRIDLARLRAMPDGTFGREAARFLDARKLDPNDLPDRPGTTETAWLRAHLFETHDLWHVVTGFDTDVPGEAGLQAFYLAQFPGRLPAVLLSILFINTFLYKFEESDARMDAITHGWALGKRAEQLLGVRWNDLFALPLSDVRTRLGLPVAGVATSR
jgi:ubiquinone biosynthesis protein Coq4